MNIQGIQKLTLLDYPGKVACTIFTGGCNFRCPFCHNAPLVLGVSKTPSVTEDEIFAFLKKRRGVLDGVAITGGEPTLHPDLPDFIKTVRELDYLVKLDSNGTNPEMLKQLIDEGLVDYVAMDIKNSQQLYAKTIGVDDFDIKPVLKSVELLMEDRVDYEFRTTMVKEFHTPDSMRDMGEWIRGAKRLFLQGFIDSGNLISTGCSPFPKEDMTNFVRIMCEYIPNTKLRGID